jgi:hypothetical protein
MSSISQVSNTPTYRKKEALLSLIADWVEARYCLPRKLLN